MNVTEKPSLAPHRCKVCGHAPPITPGAVDTKAPYVDLQREDDDVYVLNIYLCSACVEKAARLVFTRRGLAVITIDEKARLEREARELEVRLAASQAESDKLRDLLANLVDLPSLIAATAGDD